MSDLEALQAARSNLIARYEEATASPKPSYSVDGQSVGWNAYRQSLLAEIGRINGLLAAEGDPDRGPFEHVGHGCT